MGQYEHFKILDLRADDTTPGGGGGKWPGHISNAQEGDNSGSGSNDKHLPVRFPGCLSCLQRGFKGDHPEKARQTPNYYVSSSQGGVSTNDF